jgi:hypothetical protein
LGERPSARGIEEIEETDLTAGGRLLGTLASRDGTIEGGEDSGSIAEFIEGAGAGEALDDAPGDSGPIHDFAEVL